MKKSIIYAIALVLTLAAAVTSYLLLGKIKEQQEKREAANTESKSVVAQSDATQLNLDAEKAKLEKAQSEKTATEGSLDQLAASEKKLKRDVSELDAKLEEQDAKLKQIAEAQAQVKKILTELGGDVTIEQLPEKVAEVTKNRDDLSKQLEELKTNIAGAEKAVAAAREESARLADREADRNARFRANAMQSVVTAVDPDWGFVVIGAGKNTGFTPQTKLLIEREGRLIGEVKPSAVEPSQTIAEIDPDTIAPGARIQPGDTVILSEPASN
jgi:peptidoglycan hydrolase CwlO-like protein